MYEDEYIANLLKQLSDATKTLKRLPDLSDVPVRPLAEERGVTANPPNPQSLYQSRTTQNAVN
jgi:hypothetical protein